MDRLLLWWVHHPRKVVVLTSLISLLAAFSLVDLEQRQLRLQIDPSLERLLPSDDAAAGVLSRLRTQFGDTDPLLLTVRLPQVFSVEGLAAVDQLTQRLQAVPGVRDVVSLATVPNLLAEEDVLDVGSFTRQAQENPDSIPRMADQLAANPLYAGTLVADEGRVTALLLSLDGVDAETFRREGYAQRLREAATVPGVEALALTGAMVVQAATTEALLRTLAETVPTIFAIILLLLLLAFRCLKTTLVTALAISLGLLWTLAVLSVLGRPLNMVSVIVPPLILTLGLSYAVHLLAEFFSVDSETDTVDGRLRSLRRASLPLVLCGATTAAGFAALGVSEIPAVREFALLSALGVMISILLVLSFLPAMLGLLHCGKPQGQWSLRLAQGAASRIAALTQRHRSLILILAAASMAVSGLAALQIRSGAEYIQNFAPDTEVRRDFESISGALGGATLVTLYLETFVADALTQPELIREIDSLQRWLLEQPEVGSAVSYVDHLKLLHQSLNDGDPAWFRIPDTAAAVKQILLFGGSDALKRVVDPGLRSAVMSVRLKVDDSRSIAEFVGRTEVRLESLPRPLSATLTGTPVMATRTVEALGSGQWQSIVTALLVIWLLLALLFNSARAAALALLPNLTVILAYFGLLGLTGIGLNPTTSLIACIVLGVAVDDTIQFLARFNHEARASGSEARAVEAALRHTLRPVTLTSLALVTGFLAFASSELRNQVQFGLLAASTLALAWVVDLVVTPALGSRLRIVTLWDLVRLDLGQSPQHTIPIFSGLTLRETRIFALLARLEKLAAGEVLIREGDIARDMYVVVDGRVEAWIDRDGERRSLSVMTRGAVVGEAGYFGQRRTANVEAMTAARVLRFNSQDLERLRIRYPRIAATLFRNLNRVQAERLARTTALLK
jgi:uncharacterized protein